MSADAVTMSADANLGTLSVVSVSADRCVLSAAPLSPILFSAQISIAFRVLCNCSCFLLPESREAMLIAKLNLPPAPSPRHSLADPKRISQIPSRLRISHSSDYRRPKPQ